MPRKKKLVLIEDIDTATIPFQSRTTLGQYLLAAMEDRQKRTKDMSETFACAITLILPELERGDQIVV